MANATLAPFFSKYPYSSDVQSYSYGWTNLHPDYLLINQMLDMKRYSYTYMIVEPTAAAARIGEVELIDIPIPPETLAFEAYLVPKGAILDREQHFAGSAVWLGLNRTTRECERCRVTRTNIKIDISDYLKDNAITKANIDTYTLVIEGAGRLVAAADGYKRYSQEGLVHDGSVKVVLD